MSTFTCRLNGRVLGSEVAFSMTVVKPKPLPSGVPILTLPPVGSVHTTSAPRKSPTGCVSRKLPVTEVSLQTGGIFPVKDSVYYIYYRYI